MANSNLPKMTPEQMAEMRVKAAETRAKKSAIKADLTAGKVTPVALLDRAKEDKIVGGLTVETLIRSQKGVGKTRSDEIIAGLRLEPKKKIGGLGSKQRETLKAVFVG